MPAFNNVVIGDNFSDSVGTLYCSNSKTITVQVFNANVLYQLAIGRVGVSSLRGGEAWTEERLLAPGFWNFDESDFYGGVAHSIRFRNAVAGTPGTVSASA